MDAAVFYEHDRDVVTRMMLFLKLPRTRVLTEAGNCSDGLSGAPPCPCIIKWQTYPDGWRKLAVLNDNPARCGED